MFGSVRRIGIRLLATGLPVWLALSEVALAQRGRPGGPPFPRPGRGGGGGPAAVPEIDGDLAANALLVLFAGILILTARRREPETT